MRSLLLRGVWALVVVPSVTLAQPAEYLLEPVGPATISSGQTIEFEVFIDAVVAPDVLRTYQIILEIVPDPGAIGVLELADPCPVIPPDDRCPNEWPDNTSLFIDDGRPDWVFFNAGDGFPAGNIRELKIGAILTNPGDALEVLQRRYAATYIFKASPDAEGDFDVRFVLMLEDGITPATFLKAPFQIEIPFTANPPSVTVTVQQVAGNNNCVNSEPIFDGTTNFSTENTSTDGPALPLSCGGLSLEQDIWFDYVATCSGIVTISTCNDANFDTGLAVYGGGACVCPTDNTFFIECNDDGPGCASGTSELALSVTQGDCFTIRVGGAGSVEGAGGLSITCVPDLCTGAGALAVGSSVVGSTENTLVNDDIGPDCGGGAVDSPGVWYSVTGTGNRMTASLLNGTFDTRLTVYDGDCAGLACVGEADNTGTTRESVTWCSTDGIEYLILVHGVGGATGTFTLEVTDDDCSDGDLCTDDSCLAGACVHQPNFDDTTFCCAPLTSNLTLIDDGNPCTVDICSSDGSVSHPPGPNGPNAACDDSFGCTLDECIGGQCQTTSINDLDIPCSDDGDCPSRSFCGDGTGGTLDGICFCPPGSPLELAADPGSLPEDGCYANGEFLTVRVILGDGDREITGAQFFLEYDTAKLSFVDILPGASADQDSPFSFVLNERVDTGLGEIDYGVSTPLLHPGTLGPATLAVVTFQTVGDCGTFVRFRNRGPSELPHRLVAFGGDEVIPFLIFLPPITINAAPPTLSGCPADMLVPTDPGLFSTVVTWSTPTATDTCDGAVPVTCTPSSGTTFQLGTTAVSCDTTNSCGSSDSCTFDVTVESATLTVDVELSPTVASGPFDRCITFDLRDCDGPPGVQHVTVAEMLTFVNGVGSAVNVPIPGGDWECLTVRDELHTVGSTAADFSTTDGVHYTATVIGSQASGGHWLVGGNLNGDDFVDILDFGVISPLYLTLAAPDTTCSEPAPNANINGDDRVDLLDLVFITGNWAAASEPGCCGAGAAAGWGGPISAISVEELRRMGLGEMAASDLNRDGMLDMDDILLLLDGAEPPPGNGRTLRDRTDVKSSRRLGPRR